jgi:hypothetical protein
VPNYASPFLDTQPPAQWATGGGTGAPGPYQTTLGGNYIGMNTNSTNYDPNLGAKLAGTIALALIVVFVLQQSGFRFVVAAGIGA